jgi:hypothetical protein
MLHLLFFMLFKALGVVYLIEIKNKQHFKKNVASLIYETIDELEERKLCEKNVIVFNVPESDSAMSFNGMQEDTGAVADILKGIDESGNFNVTKMYRLGTKKPDKVRPIKVEFSNREQASQVVFNSRKVIDRGVKIKRDLTLRQRHEITQLWKEVESRRDNGEINLTVRWVNSKPKIVQTHNRSRDTKN